MSKKTENAKFAKEWCKQVESSEKWMNYIKRSLDDVLIRKDVLITEDERKYIKTRVNTSTTEIMITSDKTHKTLVDLIENGVSYGIGVLNFASYYKPGGGFLKGSFTQEESLCAVSGLYHILSRLSVYECRRKSKDIAPCYNDEIIYSLSVPFTLEIGNTKHPRTVDVISCSPPNCKRITMADRADYEESIKKRIEAIYLLPYMQGVDTLILGAWGCGVFKNDPKVIARHFIDIMDKYPNIYDRVIFACGSNANQKIFENAFIQKPE